MTANIFAPVLAWVKKETGLVETKVVAVEPEAIAWVESFLKSITPAVRQAATDAVIAAVSVPGTGTVKAVAALGIAAKDLVEQGLPVVETDLKAAIQIAYHALPSSLASNAAVAAVVGAANSVVDKAAADVAKEAAPLESDAAVTTTTTTTVTGA